MFKKKAPPPSQPGGGRQSVSEPDAPERPPKPGTKPKEATPTPHDDDDMDDGTTLYNEVMDIVNNEEKNEPTLYEETAQESRRSNVPEPSQEEYTFVDEGPESTYEDTSEMEKIVANKRMQTPLPDLPTSHPPKKDPHSKGKTQSDPHLPPDVPAHTSDGNEEKRRPSAGVGVFGGMSVSMDTIREKKANLRKVPSIAEEPKSPEPETQTISFKSQLKPVNKPQISPKPSVGQTHNDHTTDWSKGLRKTSSKSPPVSPRSPTSPPNFSTADDPDAPPPLPNRPSGKATSQVHVAQNGSSDTIVKQSHVAQNGSTGGPRATSEAQFEEEDTYADGFSLIEPLSSSEWFHGCLSRDDAEAKLRETNQNGAYLVRKTDKDIPYKEKPYILSVMTKGDMYNLILRQRADGKYALGKEKENELAFERVEELLKFHKTEKLVLIRNGRETFTVLTSYPSAER
ncbi:uncharacterized protein LOC127842433 isoform X2 [Dreissena polymorpha]|uniref:uncharacterized protein LOC127842433 isoform X2 n=1 Tax=Dreissena polymorpha TaxID=45954 RepID=UPI0022650E4E|nr:uncharacterized protein LOC127842433 isoform X2 [Dreissena polymorpha]